MGDTGDAVKSQVYSAHPELEPHVEHQIDRFGQVSFLAPYPSVIFASLADTSPSLRVREEG